MQSGNAAGKLCSCPRRCSCAICFSRVWLCCESKPCSAKLCPSVAASPKPWTSSLRKKCGCRSILPLLGSAYTERRNTLRNTPFQPRRAFRPFSSSSQRLPWKDGRSLTTIDRCSPWSQCDCAEREGRALWHVREAGWQLIDMHMPLSVGIDPRQAFVPGINQSPTSPVVGTSTRHSPGATRRQHSRDTSHSVTGSAAHLTPAAP